MKYELPSTELIVIEENNYLKFGEYLNDMQCDDTANKLSLDDLEYVKKLQQENKKLNGTIQTYDILLKANVEENKQLKDKWNELKEWLRIKDILANSKINPQSIKFKDLLKHMEYLEKER